MEGEELVRAPLSIFIPLTLDSSGNPSNMEAFNIKTCIRS